MIMIFLTYFK